MKQFHRSRRGGGGEEKQVHCFYTESTLGKLEKSIFEDFFLLIILAKAAI
jgi:hypothetical protein